MTRAHPAGRHFVPLWIAFAMLTASCQFFASHPAVVVGAWNDTDLAVAIRANGRDVAILAPGASLPGDAAIPLPPFVIEAATATGRVLVRLTLSDEDVAHALTGGMLELAVLPCGRVIIWAGVPPSLPAEPPGERMPCDP